jgi:hypothetical protein
LDGYEPTAPATDSLDVFISIVVMVLIVHSSAIAERSLFGNQWISRKVVF